MAAVPSAPPPSYEAANKTGNSNVAPYQPPYPDTRGYASNPHQQPTGYNSNQTQQPYSQPAAGAQQYQGYPQPQPYGQPVPPQSYQDYPESGFDGDEVNAFNTASFSDKVVRNRFIRKVYLILMCQLLFTTALVAVFVSVSSVKNWVRMRRNSWFYYLAYVTFFVTYIVLACCPRVRMKFPGNYIALFVFTAAFSYVCAAIASYHDAQAVLIAAGITALVTFSISMFAIQTKIDFTMCYGLMFAASMVLIFMGLAMIIVFIAVPNNEAGYKTRFYLQCVYGAIAALILCLFLVFDTQRIVGGKNRKNPVSPEEHILGAMELYLDIVYLFLIILSCFGGSKN